MTQILRLCETGQYQEFRFPHKYPPMWSQIKQTERVEKTIVQYGETDAKTAEGNRAVEVAVSALNSWLMDGSSVHVCLTNNILRTAEDVMQQVDPWEFAETPQTWESVKDFCKRTMSPQIIQYYDYVDRQREVEMCVAYLSAKQTAFHKADDPLAEALVLASFDFIADFLGSDVVDDYLDVVLRAATVDIGDRTLLRQSLANVVPVNIWIEPEDETLTGYQTKLFFVPKTKLMEFGTTHGPITRDADTTLYLNLNKKTSKNVAQPQKDMLKQILECPSAEEHYLRCTPYGIKSSETIVLEDDSKTTATTSFKLDVPTSDTISTDFGTMHIISGNITLPEAISEARLYLTTRQCESTVIQWSENTYGFTLDNNVFVVRYD